MKKHTLAGAILLCVSRGSSLVSLQRPGEVSVSLKPLNTDRRNKGDKKRQRSEWRRAQNKK